MSLVTWKIMILGLLLILFHGARPGFALAVEAPRVLVIRPERLKGIMIPGQAVTTARDPFNWPPETVQRPAEKKPDQRPDVFSDVTLNGIIWGETHPMAFINNRLVSVGDKVKGATVLDIYREAVVLEYEGVYHTLRLTPVVTELNPPGANP